MIDKIFKYLSLIKEGPLWIVCPSRLRIFEECPPITRESIANRNLTSVRMCATDAQTISTTYMYYPHDLILFLGGGGGGGSLQYKVLYYGEVSV